MTEKIRLGIELKDPRAKEAMVELLSTAMLTRSDVAGENTESYFEAETVGSGWGEIDLMLTARMISQEDLEGLILPWLHSLDEVDRVGYLDPTKKQPTEDYLTTR